MQVKINISLKTGVLDPQGRAVENALSGLGFNDASQVRIGKQITLDIDAEDSARAEQRAARMCESLLANTVIEDYSIEVIDAS
jgi:phosphoribosylformylglycinamidine synthase